MDRHAAQVEASRRAEARRRFEAAEKEREEALSAQTARRAAERAELDRAFEERRAQGVQCAMDELSAQIALSHAVRAEVRQASARSPSPSPSLEP